MTRHFDQRSVLRAAPEKVEVLDTRSTAREAGGEIRGSSCGAVAGRSLHGPMT
jgi:hypothetical protein